MVSILPTGKHDNYYVMRNPTVSEFDTTPHMSETEVNTERITMKSTSMRHSEGGWPKDVDITELSDVARFRKRVEKDQDYQNAMKVLGSRVGRCMRQNNTINVYEDYFCGEEAVHRSEPPFAKGLALFRDPSAVKRTVSSIDWHPDGGRIAVSYSVLNFQDSRLLNTEMFLSVSAQYLKMGLLEKKTLRSFILNRNRFLLRLTVQQFRFYPVLYLGRE